MRKLLMTDGAVSGNSNAEILQNAYDMAVWLDPSIREKLIAAQTAQNPQKDPAIKRKAAVSLSGSPRGQAPVNRQQTNGTVIDDVRAAVEAHGGL